MVKRSGYSVIELMLVVAILGIIGSVGATLMLQANRAYISAKARQDLQRDSRAAMYLITRELRHARAMSIVIDRASAAQPFCSRITFTRVQGNTIQIYQSGNKLVHTSGGKTQTILQNLGYLAFTFPRSDDLAVISVALTLQQGIYLGQKKALHMASENIQVMN